MKKSKFSDSQILSIIKQAENGMPIPELCREHGISSATFYNWRSRYEGMDASLIKKQIENLSPNDYILGSGDIVKQI